MPPHRRMQQPSPPYLWHVGLGIGQGTRELRSAVTDGVLRVGGEHIRRALSAPAGDDIPGQPGYVMVAKSGSGTLLCFVGRREGNLALATFGVAPRSDHAAKLWHVLHEDRPEYAVSRGDVPRTPYCAVRAEFGLGLDPRAGEWLDGYQIAVAWAWIEKRT